MRHCAIITALCACAFSGCSGHKDGDGTADEDIVAQFRDSILYLSDVDRQLPPDISTEDSLALRQTIIDSWIDGILIEDLAETQITDMERIDRLTDAYRRSLIADSYKRQQRDKSILSVDQDSISAYYKGHRRELRLERPIVKGLYIKLPKSSGMINDIREWMRDSGPESLDALENRGVREAVQYEYFADRWMDFDVLAGEIPYRFGDADMFVSQTTDFETEWNGMVYILHIGEYRRSGETMPEQYASPIIEERIKANMLANYEHNLIKALRVKAIEKGILTIPARQTPP